MAYEGLISEEEKVELVGKIASVIDKENLSSNVLGKNEVKIAVEKILALQRHQPEVCLEVEVISAFDIPKYKYDETQKRFVSAPNRKTLFSTAEEKSLLYRERYLLILQRLRRNSIFAPPPLWASTRRSYHKLLTVDSLSSIMCASGAEDQNLVVLFGMLSQLEEGKFYLEDLTGHVLLDFTEAKVTAGLFVENSMALVQGLYAEGLLRVQVLGSPPTESKELSRDVLKSANFFGGTFVHDYFVMDELGKKEADNETAMIVCLSDVWLDKPEVLEKLNELLRGYEPLLPEAFIFMGNFSRGPQSAHSFFELRVTDLFKKLAGVLAQYKQLVMRSKFIFVPGPQDPGPGHVLPRPPLPDVLTKPLKDLLKHNAVFATNPCRVRYGTQEIVVFREDLIAKLKRNSVLTPSADEGPLHFHMVKTLMEQSHLSPLPLHASPIYWWFDHALRLYPLPDTLILGDQYAHFTVEYEGVSCFNPGSFLSSGFHFMVYWLAARKPELSRVR
ncbi:DNA polymerase epsilon subunit 2-like isoform X2 [Zophobas morio]|uniref:DNA polymerase epsilon subunit 2-like isoform X2 n=1 Tax=Zophobas morio TaxID=2755281 RepID=UPI003082A07E